jgi:hypothetical protein
VKLKLNTLALGAALLAACGGNDNTGPLGNVDALVILQRTARNDMGDIFQYTSYVPGAKLIKLSPPTADGKRTVLCCDKAGPEFANIDIQAYDISFDAKQIVFAGKLSDNDHYGLFLLTLADGSVVEIPTDPGRDYVSPIFLPGDKIMFTTNNVVKNLATDAAGEPIDPNPPQHVDEYERGTTIQIGTINIDGTNEQLGPRNLSHRTAPSLASDGRVIFTQWDHLGMENSGHLMFMNTDMTELREAFGKEGTGASNSTLKAMEISPGRFVGIATARNRTINAGALIDIRLGIPSKTDSGDIVADTSMSEANASYVMLTPDVPIDNSPSANTIGRYYDAYALDAKEHPELLVSWADGPVESSVLAAANMSADFGVYLYDTATMQRHPILDDKGVWDIFARPLQPRTAPPMTSSSIDSNLGGVAEIGAMNVYDSTLHTFNPGEIYGVRVMEGFSSEEGFPRMFGTTMFEGHANLGVARVAADGSWLATVPANVPLHLQTVDNFGMSLFNEPVWFSARAGETRVCGGCHEDRAKTTVINPGITQAFAIGPTNAKGLVPRDNRLTAATDLANANLIQADGTGADKIIGVAWDKAIQPIFDAKCISCHNGVAGPANPTYQIVNPMTGASTTYTFDLTNKPIQMLDMDGMTETWPSSYFFMAGPDMEAIEKNMLMITGTLPCKTITGEPTAQCMIPEDARESDVIRRLNPTKLFPQPDTSVRAFTGVNPHSAEQGFTELTPTEFYKMILVTDMGVNFYARENNPHNATY